MLKSSTPHKTFLYPSGELQVILEKPYAHTIEHTLFEFTDNASIFELLFFVDAAKRSGHILNTLIMPYIPFSRQDRISKRGESFTLCVFADLINSLGYQKVVVTDPHSDVSSALLKNCVVVSQEKIWAPHFEEKEGFWLVAPDAGAAKKIYKLAAMVKCRGIVECSKMRNLDTGEITDTKIHATNLENRDAYLIDDICAGGATFIAVAKELKKLNVGKVILCVSHGFFTRGMDELNKYFDEIHTRIGRIK